MKQENGQPERSSQSHKGRLELLAPAGSFETCRAVIHAGADALYLGGSRFGARAYARNLTQEELSEAIDYAHLHGCKVFLTVNTLLKQPEMRSLYQYLLPYYEQGLDAVIVQDFGVMQMVRNYFPDLAIHISTQMSVTGAYGAAYLKSLGAKRIVTARELSLEEICAIHSQTDIEIESFVHGALCYSYSGQCLLSSMLGGRSGNRGRCAQPCRLPYAVLDENRQMLTRPDCYPLSPKDLCALQQIPELAAAGVYSFKIEGRMKSAEYAAGVVSVYRKIIDQYLDTGKVSIQKQDKQHLLDTGNRSGFTSGYHTRHNGRDMITMTQPGHTKDDGAFLQSVHEKYIEKEQKLPVRAEAYLKIKEPAVLNVFYKGLCASVQCGIAEPAQKQPLSRDMVIGQLSKTGNTPFVMESIEVMMDSPIFLPKQTLNQLRREAIEKLTEMLLSPYRRTAGEAAKIQAADPRTDNTSQIQAVDSRADSTSQIQATDSKPDTLHVGDGRTCFYASVEETGQLDAVLACSLITRIYLDSSMYLKEDFIKQLTGHVSRIHAAGKQAYLVLPAIFRLKTAQFYKRQWLFIEQTGIDGFLAKNHDELGFLDAQQVDKDRCVSDHSLYTYSDDTKSCYAAAGWMHDTVPLELNRKELLARDNTASELIIYGRMPLMTSAQCICKTLGQCHRTPTLRYLKDRYAKEFPVKNNCSECYNTIYNSQPLSLLQLADELARLRAAAYRLQFTIESKAQAHKVLDCCEQAFFKHCRPDMEAVVGAYTNGHYKRGVE